MLLDLSVSFDIVDHQTLMEVLQRRFGVSGKALDWLADYLNGRCQVVRAGGSDSENSALHFGVPQGSVLGTKAFLEYAEDVAHLMEGLQYHLFADDMQGQKHGRPADVPAIIQCFIQTP